jgi:hypothetical protein
MLDTDAAVLAEEPAEPRPLATVRNYSDLHIALRARVAQLALTHEVLNEETGLPGGYVNKLLAPVPIKRLGPQSLGPLLTALGLKLVVMEDVETLERMSRIPKRLRPGCSSRATDAGETMPAKRRKERRGFRTSEAGRLMRARWQLLVPEAERRRISRIAARARWSAARRDA